MTPRPPQATVIPPAAAAGVGGVTKTLGNLAIAMLALTLIAAAGVLFLLFIILRRVLYLVWVPIATVLDVVTYMVTAILVATVQRLIVWAVVGLVSAGLVYTAFEYSPRLKSTLNGYYGRIQAEVRGFTGIDISLPSLHEVMDIITRKGSVDNLNPLHPEMLESQVQELERIKDINIPMPDIAFPTLQLPDMQLPEIPNAAQLKEIVDKNALPKELLPLLGVVMQPEMLAQFRALEKSGALEKGAEVALPLLQRGLYSPDPALSSAALQSLAAMNSPQSRKLLADYQKLIQQIMQDAARGANTRH